MSANESESFDLVVIGAGSGGVRASRIAAGLGAKVAVIEERFYGGTCVNVGCVPKKMFAYASSVTGETDLAASFGYDVAVNNFNWQTLRDNKTKEIERLNGIYQRMLNNAGVKIFDGHGKILSSTEVEVNGVTLNTKKIIIATGGKPFVPDVPGKEHALISDDLFYLDNLPDTAAVVGGGYIACEFASILAGLGVETHLLYRGDMVLRGFDQDIRPFVTEQMSQHGVKIHTNTDIEAISGTDQEKNITLNTGDTLNVGAVIYATGRVPNLDNLLADGLELEFTQSGKVAVDDTFTTNIDGVYAIGDIIEGPELTPVALEEGMWLANYFFAENKPQPISYDMLPTAVFCEPNIGVIGITEEEARAKYGEVTIYRSAFRPMRYTLSDIQRRTLMKLIVDDASQRVVGFHMAGDDAAEITQGFAVGMKMGATKADFDSVIGIHPTSAEEFVTMRTPVTENN